MKKVFLSIIAGATLLGTSVAQDFKPAGGEKNIEVQLAPLGGSPVSIGGIRVRMFQTATSALRGTVFLGYTSNSTITQQANSSANLEELKTTNSSITVNIRPGIESHFEGTDRLSPYIGGELDFAIKTSSNKVQTQAGAGAPVVETTTTGTDGYLRIGLNGVAGMDYYFAKNVYLGTELGFGFSLTSLSQIKVDSDAAGFTAPDPQKQGSSISIGPNVLGQLRLGYLF